MEVLRSYILGHGYWHTSQSAVKLMARLVVIFLLGSNILIPKATLGGGIERVGIRGEVL